MKGEARILDVELLEEKEILHEIDEWLTLLNWDNGWHYDLDIIWILKSLEKNNIKPGSTILDAGAGMGVLQFILAARGYNVISLDFAKRSMPTSVLNLFDFKMEENEVEDENPYRSFMRFDKGARKEREVSIAKLITFSLKKRFGGARSRFITLLNNIKNKKYKGSIKILQASFNEIPLESNSVDAVVSISAIEHNDFDLNGRAVSEFERILNNNGVSLVTTSVADQEKSWFHKESMGWCFSEKDINDIFGADLIGKYEAVKKRMLSSTVLKKRLSMAYKISSRNGLPHGDFNKIQYLPVGIMRKKSLDESRKQ